MGFFDKIWKNTFGGITQKAVQGLDLTGQKGAKRAERKNQNNVNAALGSAQAGTDAALGDYNLSLEQFQEALAFFQQGFPGVMDELNAVGDASLSTAYDTFQQASGAIDDSLIGSGRFGTSARESLQGGERSRYMRDVADINEGLGQLRSNVRLQGLNSTVGLMQQLGGAFERRGQISERGGFKQADTRMKVQYQAPPGLLQQMGGAGGVAQVAGLFA